MKLKIKKEEIEDLQTHQKDVVEMQKEETKPKNKLFKDKLLKLNQTSCLKTRLKV